MLGGVGGNSGVTLWGETGVGGWGGVVLTRI